MPPIDHNNINLKPVCVCTDDIVSSELLLKINPALSTTRTASIVAARGTIVDWGDGTSVTAASDGLLNHTYTVTSPVIMAITPTTQTISSTTYRVTSITSPILEEVIKWPANKGTIRTFAFVGSHNLTKSAEPTKAFTEYYRMFSGCRAFNQDLRPWDFSHVTSLQEFLKDAWTFNQPIVEWETGNVTNFNSMLDGARAFNQPIVGLNNSASNNMGYFLRGATAFNQSVDGLNLSTITFANNFLEGATSFNQPVNGIIFGQTGMNVNAFFKGCTAFNQPINWDFTHFNNIGSLVESCPLWNHPVNGWNVAHVTNVSNLFRLCPLFNQPMTSWTLSNVNNATGMFEGCSAFNQPVEHFNMINCVSFAGMFRDCVIFNQPVNNIGVTNKATNLSTMFQNARAFNQPINNFDTTNVSDFRRMFSSAIVFENDITTLVKAAATNIAGIIESTPRIRQSLALWNVSNVTDFSEALQGNKANGIVRDSYNISGWDVSKGVVFSGMFANSDVEEDLSSWNVSNGQFFNNMFASNEKITSYIGIEAWNVEKGRRFDGMFNGAILFDGDLGLWRFPTLPSRYTVSPINVGVFDNFLRNAAAYTATLANWCVPNVTGTQLNFATGSGLIAAQYPVWGTCP